MHVGQRCLYSFQMKALPLVHICCLIIAAALQPLMFGRLQISMFQVPDITMSHHGMQSTKFNMN